VPAGVPKMIGATLRLTAASPDVSAICVRSAKYLDGAGAEVTPERSALAWIAGDDPPAEPLVSAWGKNDLWPVVGDPVQQIGLRVTLQMDGSEGTGYLVGTWCRSRNMAAQIHKNSLSQRRTRCTARAASDSYKSVIYRTKSTRVTSGPAGARTEQLEISDSYHRIGERGYGVKDQYLVLHWRKHAATQAYNLGVIKIRHLTLPGRPERPWVESARGQGPVDGDVREDVLMRLAPSLDPNNPTRGDVFTDFHDLLTQHQNMTYAPQFYGGGATSFMGDAPAADPEDHLLDLTNPLRYTGPNPPSGGTLVGECRDYAALVQAHLGAVGFSTRLLKLEKAQDDWFVCNHMHRLGSSDFVPIANGADLSAQSWWDSGTGGGPNPNIEDFGVVFHVVLTDVQPTDGALLATPPYTDYNLQYNTIWDACGLLDGDGQPDVVSNSQVTPMVIDGLSWSGYADALVGHRANPSTFQMHGGIHTPDVIPGELIGVKDGIVMGLPTALTSTLTTTFLTVNSWFSRTLETLDQLAAGLPLPATGGLRLAMESVLTGSITSVPGILASVMDNGGGLRFVNVFVDGPSLVPSPHTAKLLSWNFAFDGDGLGRLGPGAALEEQFATRPHVSAVNANQAGWIWFEGNGLQMVVAGRAVTTTVGGQPAAAPPRYNAWMKIVLGE
jgi:hypothetical protein